MLGLRMEVNTLVFFYRGTVQAEKIDTDGEAMGTTSLVGSGKNIFGAKSALIKSH